MACKEGSPEAHCIWVALWRGIEVEGNALNDSSSTGGHEAYRGTAALITCEVRGGRVCSVVAALLGTAFPSAFFPGGRNMSQ